MTDIKYADFDLESDEQCRSVLLQLRNRLDDKGVLNKTEVAMFDVIYKRLTKLITDKELA